ncbi:SH3 domain-containing protein [Anaerolineales bacterium HSG6]|nr:SH3 domain-containing protein [Anaerolineales bacterium HSG6]
MKIRYVSLGIVLLLINYLIFATIAMWLLEYDFRGSSTVQRTPQPTFTPAPAAPQLFIPTATPVVPIPTPTSTRVIQGTAESVSPDTPTPQSANGAEATTLNGVNLRAGPGVDYQVVGQLEANVTMPIVGRNSDSSWWQIELDDGRVVWLSGQVVETSQTENVPVR